MSTFLFFLGVTFLVYYTITYIQLLQVEKQIKKIQEKLKKYDK